MSKKNIFKHIGDDLSAGLVVFLVALPLCLGISLASDAPLFSGLIAGVIGGIVVGTLSGSTLGVSGPAAGLAVIVANGISSFDSYQIFLLAVVIGGVLQVLLGVIGAGKIAFFFPSSVIKGMLAAIGITIILKQIPHAFGIDSDPEGEMEFIQSDGQNTFSELLNLNYFETGALVIGLLSILLLIFWDSKFIKRNKILKLIPGPLLAVIFGIIMNQFFSESLKLGSEHLVTLPKFEGFSGFASLFTYPDFSAISNINVIKTGFVLAIIASLETLLSVEATDRLDPSRNVTPTNKELMAQGVGNIFSGMIGGIPITQVIVRSSANIQAGGKSKLATIFHGILLLVSVTAFPFVLNMIPLSALAAILIIVGYKLAKPELFISMYKEGQDQLIPFLVTIIAILFTDLLIGIVIGLMVGIGYVLYTNFKASIKCTRVGNEVTIDFKKDVFFYNRAELVKILSSLKNGDVVTFDGRNIDFIDFDIYLAITEFASDSKEKGIEVNQLGITRNKISYKLENN